VVGLLGASCNAILGLDEVRPVPADGQGGGGSGGPAGGTSGRSCGSELLTNGTFDVGMTSWNEAPERTALVRKFDDPDVQAHQVTPQSGLYVLRLGAPSTDSYVVHYVEQYADIPADAQEITISGYVQVRTEEDRARVYDEAWVQLFDEFQRSTPFFSSVPRWSNLTQADSWTTFSFPVDVTSIAGKQMVFQLIADLDTGVPTYFYFDTVSVAVTGCGP
jgi:hypothetical protein